MANLGAGNFGNLFANLLQQNWDNRQDAPPQQQAPPQVGLAIDPSIIGLLQQLQQGAAAAGGQQQQQQRAADDANMMNMIQGLLGQVVGAMAGAGGGGQQQQQPATVSQFLSSLPDFAYEEGQSLLTDFLMSLARSLTFQDVLRLMSGDRAAVAGLRAPLRTFAARHVMRAPEQQAGESYYPSREDIEVSKIII